MFLSVSDFSQVVSNTPLISIDLCLLRGKEILLGKRKNPPARDYFFVPGGRILKSESQKLAFERILKNELGMVLKKNHYKNIKNLGIYEHFYTDNFLENTNFSTHYVVIAFLVPYKSLINIEKFSFQEQHSQYIWQNIETVKKSPHKIHKYTLEYFRNPLFQNLL